MPGYERGGEGGGQHGKNSSGTSVFHLKGPPDATLTASVEIGLLLTVKSLPGD